MSKFSNVSPSSSSITGYFYKVQDSLTADNPEYEDTKLDKLKPFYLPGLDLLEIVCSIPYEHQKSATLTFDLSTKNQIILKAQTSTAVATKTVLTRHAENWHLKIKQNDQTSSINNIKVIKGSLPYLFTGCIEVLLKNTSSEDLTIPENLVIAKLVCKHFKY